MANIQQADAESPVALPSKQYVYTPNGLQNSLRLEIFQEPFFFQVNIDLVLINSKILPFVPA